MNLVDKLIRSAKILHEKGCLQEARNYLNDAFRLAPENIEVLSQLGYVCGALGDHAAAIFYLEAIQRLNPGQMEVLFGLGVEYYHSGCNAEAVELFDNLIDKYPSLPILHHWRGVTLAELGRSDEACFAFKEALRIQPEYCETLIALGGLLAKARRLEEAESYLNKAIHLNAESSAAYTDIAGIYRLQGRHTEAMACFRRAFVLSPNSKSLANNLLYFMCYPDNITPEENAQEHKRICGRLFPEHEKREFRSGQLDQKAHLRIGYISGDLYSHSVAFFMEPVLIHHDRKKFSIYCYSNRNVADLTTERLKNLDVQWREVFGLSAENVAKLIEDDGIDLLVDLSGHTAGNRLDVCAMRPAPIQVSWLGYPHSTGMTQIDYYLSDNQCDPVGMTDHLYSERVWRLPRVFCCYLPPIEFPPIAPAPFLLNGMITFGSFNNFAKLTDTAVNLWAEILKKVPGSQLLLKSFATGGEAVQDTLRARFSDLGIATNRIVMVPYAAGSLQHLAQYACIDIALDTYPYNGTTTTCESLWMGVPVVTLAGRTHLSRVGVSLLSSVGLMETVAETPDLYIELAVKLANDPKRLLLLREKLRGMMAISPLMDAAGITRDVESAYRSMYAGRRDK